MRNRSKKKSFLLFILIALSLCFLTSCDKEREKSSISKVSDLVGKTIGVQLGTTGDIYATDEAKNEKGTKVERFNKGNDAIQALKQSKVDCVIIDEQPAKAYVEKNTDLSILKEEFAVEEYAICVSKDNQELKTKINQTLEKLKKDGTIQWILDNYIGDDTKGKSPYQSPKDIKRENGVLTMATNVAFPPYEFYSNGSAVGIDVDIATAVADQLGMSLVISDMEFDSIITAVQSKKADIGAAGMTVTEARLKNIDFTDSYTTAKQVVVVRNGTASVTNSLKDKFYQNFVEDNRWQYLAKGLGNTLLITIFAALMGIILGFVIAIIRVAHDKNGTLKIANLICKCYLTVVRGTPVMVQLLIIYYVIFVSIDMNKVIVAIIAFGLNSAAYVAEVVRSGIISIEKGQFEAGRSLGLTYGQTMWNIVLPQAFKNVLPALGNELIALLKESSVSGYIGLVDLTKGGDIIRSNTYEAFLPLLAVAVIYLLIVMLLSKGVNRLERRLVKDER